MSQKTYSFRHAMFDLFMVCITSGLWLIYLICKYLRTH